MELWTLLFRNRRETITPNKLQLVQAGGLNVTLLKIAAMFLRYSEDEDMEPNQRERCLFTCTQATLVLKGLEGWVINLVGD